MNKDTEHLLLELKCCFHLQPWNTVFIFASIQEWAQEIGWIAFYNDHSCMTVKDAVMLAEKEAIRLYEFVRSLES